MKDADGGQPLSGVVDTLDTSGNEQHKLELDYGSPAGMTNFEGQDAQNFLVSPYPSDSPHWYLKLTKEGYEPMILDIKSAHQPRNKDTTPLEVLVRLRPTRAKPRSRRARMSLFNSPVSNTRQLKRGVRPALAGVRRSVERLGLLASDVPRQVI